MAQTMQTPRTAPEFFHLSFLLLFCSQQQTSFRLPLLPTFASFLLVRTAQSLPESPLLLLIGLQRWDWFHSSVDFDCNRVVNNCVREVGE